MRQAEPVQGGRTFRRGGAVAIAVTTVTLALVGLPSPASGVASPCWNDVLTDVDGGGPDVIVGMPSYDLPGKTDAGALVIFSNVAVAGEADPVAPTTRTLVTADDITGLTAQTGARFGASVVIWQDSGAFDDADDCSDVLVGVPGQTVDGKVGAGQVVMLAGTPTGLGPIVRTFDEASLEGTGGAQAGAGFGSVVAADTSSMIAVGAPGRDVAGATDAGRVVRLDYSHSQVDPVVRLDEQGGANAGSPEAGDRFGEALDLIPTGQGPILVIGIPHEDVGTRVDAGAVGMIPAAGTLTMVTQDSPGAAGTAEAGDRYGSTIEIFATYIDNPVGVVVIGVPGEDLAGIADVGMISFASFNIIFDPVEIITPISGRAQTLTQNSSGVPGSRESGDRFGSAVLAGEFGQDTGTLHLVATAPWEDVGRVAAAGMLSMTRVEANGTPKPGIQPAAWTQNATGVPGAAEAGDRFGGAVSSVQLTTLEDDIDSVWSVIMVTVPGEDLGSVVDAGMAYLGVAPGARSIALVPPVAQTGAGLGMVPMVTG